MSDTVVKIALAVLALGCAWRGWWVYVAILCALGLWVTVRGSGDPS